MNSDRENLIDSFVGSSPAMRKVFSTIRRVANANVDVLIIGETGTGKELVARSVHDLSDRHSGPFVPVDCGAIPESLLESEFFGYEKGAFTGAERQRTGLLEMANGGTFFLDELGDLPLVLQAKLLRTLQERKLRRVGGNEEVDVDVRIVAATSRDLDRMVRERTFRDDLFYRINVVRIDLPPLRERGDDLGLLAEWMVEKISRENSVPIPAISTEAWSILSRYKWPGNVRELQNVIRRALALSDNDKIEPEDLPIPLVAAASAARGNFAQTFFELRDEHLARFEREYFKSLLERHSGNCKEAAKEARLPRGTLYRHLKNHNIQPADFRRRSRGLPDERRNR
ncbi:MAG: sigma-54 dependent transcriptional regulator [Planctomycetota bacterium]|nr:sigma-54 dependent transcriptional regulator [Planctomycetota bacterium]MDA1249252.1 sigma-54 dependent transcriptional regulator [Planctomycetota bacterium]